MAGKCQIGWANSGVIGKTISNFLDDVHCRYFNISKVVSQIDKHSEGVTLALYKYMGQDNMALKLIVKLE